MNCFIKILFLILLITSCNNSLEQKEVCNNSFLRFILSNDYYVSKYKKDIPKFIIDSLSSLYKCKFEIGDVNYSNEISLGCVRTIDRKYCRKLNFILYNNTSCVMHYTQGGIGVHYVVEHFTYGTKFRHERYTTTNFNIDCLDSLKKHIFEINNPEIMNYKAEQEIKYKYNSLDELMADTL